jgi:anti-sigma factor RsiW
LNLQVTLSSDDVPMRVEISGKAICWSSRFHTAGQTSRGSAAGVFFDMPWNRLALAAAIALAAIVASSFLPRLRQPGADQFLATQLIARHVRSLMASHLTDATSSDEHTVKPWLDVKLDFAARVVDLSSEGFPSLADAWI